MPLHDWTNLPGWDGVHHLWITELLRTIKPQLPPDYRAYIGTAPALGIGTLTERPDVGVRQWTDSPQRTEPGSNGKRPEEPDEEIAVAVIDPATAIFVEQHGRLISAVELISPRNKDRPVSRDTYLSRYASYLLRGAHLLLVDLHPRPLGFSFADKLAEVLQIQQPPTAPPLAVSYRVGEPAATGGRLLAIWRRALRPGQILPEMPLPLGVDSAVTIDLEATYMSAARDAYLA